MALARNSVQASIIGWTDGILTWPNVSVMPSWAPSRIHERGLNLRRALITGLFMILDRTLLPSFFSELGDRASGKNRFISFSMSDIQSAKRYLFWTRKSSAKPKA